MRRVVLLALLALLPVSVWADSVVDVSNKRGTLSLNATDVTLTDSALKGADSFDRSNLRTLSFTAGALTNGSLAADQSFTFLTGSTFQSMSGDAVAAVPEPGTLGLLGTGLIGLAGLVRRRLRTRS